MAKAMSGKIISVDDIKFLKEISYKLNDIDRVRYNEILDKIDSYVDTYNKNKSATSKKILEMRKEDKWYGRSIAVIQTHFDKVAKNIKLKLLTGKSNEARKLYEVMVDEAKFPRHKLQFDNAVQKYLNDVDIEFLKWK